MSLNRQHPNPLAVLDAVIADLRAMGDTGHVENLLQARADISELAHAARSARNSYQAFPSRTWLDQALEPFGRAS